MSVCSKCNAQIDAQGKCLACTKPTFNKYAILSLVFAGFCIYPGFFVLEYYCGICAVISLVLAYISFKQIKKTGSRGKVAIFLASLISFICVVIIVAYFVFISVSEWFFKQIIKEIQHSKTQQESTY